MTKYAILGYIATRKSVTLMFWWCLDIHVIKSYIMGWREYCTTSFFNCCLASNINLVLLGTYIIAKDPHFDPFYVWGNEIFMNQHQVRKLIKIVIKMGQKMSIELFVYTLCKTTVNCRMVSKNHVAFFLLPIMSCFRWQYLNLFSFVVDPEAVYSRLPLKLHDWRPTITRGWTRVLHAFCIQESTIGPFRFILFSNWNVCRLFLYHL